MGVEIFYKIKYDPKFCPRRKDLVKISKSGRNRFILANDETRESYFTDSSAIRIWKLMDGRHSMLSIKRRLSHRHNPEDVEGFITFAAQEKLIENVEDETHHDKMKKLAKRNPLHPQVISPLSINMPILDATKSSALFRRLYRVTRFLFNKVFLLFAIVMVGLAAFLLRDYFISTLSSESSFSMQGSTILGFFVFSVILIFPILIIHELAHGLTLTHFGANPGELGTGFYYFSPMFYCDTSESWRLTRGKRVLVSLSGPLSTLFIGSIAGLLAMFNIIPNATYLFAITFFFSYYITLLNMAPMFETDGYYALMDALSIPNLRSEALGYIKTVLTKGVREANSRYDEYGGKQRFAMFMYGVISVLWSILAIYLSYLFLSYIIQDAVVQVNNLTSSVITITGISGRSIEEALISIGVAAGSLGLLTFISVRLYAMTYLSLKSVASRVQRPDESLLSIDSAYLSIFFLVPTLFPSMRRKLLRKLKWIASKISKASTLTDEGELVVIRSPAMISCEKTLNQVRSDAARYETVFRKYYGMYMVKFLKALRKNQAVNEFYTIGKNNSIKVASLLKQKDFLKGFNERIEKVYSDVDQLLRSFMCFVWSIDLRPDAYSKLTSKDFEYPFLEDISTSTISHDVGIFRREKVIGSENIENFLKGMTEYFNTLRENPRIMQTTHATALFEPIKNSLMIFGRARRVGDLRKVAESIFLMPMRSALETATLPNLSTSFLRLSRFVEQSPTFMVENIKDVEFKELKFLDRVLEDFVRSLTIVGENIESMQRITEAIYLRSEEAEKEVKALDYDVALLDLIIKTTEYNSNQLDANKRIYSALLREKKRLLGKLEGLRQAVEEAIRQKQKPFSRALRRTGLVAAIALFSSTFLAIYLNLVLEELGLWNLIFIIPVFVIGLASALSFARLLRISSKGHSSIIDSLLLLSNHYYSLGSNTLPVKYLFGEIE